MIISTSHRDRLAKLQAGRYQGLTGKPWFAPVILASLFIPVFVIILLDRRAWPWDEAFYGEFSVGLFRTLAHHTVDWPYLMVHALSDRPPAIAWIGQFFVPLGKMFPYVQTGLLFSVLLTQLASIIILYFALKKIFEDSLSALLACSLISAAPLFFSLTYRFLVEPLQLLSVVWLLAIVAFNERLTRLNLVTHSIAAVTFGLLVKPSTPAFQLPLIFLGVFLAFRKLPEAIDKRKQLSFVGVAAAAILVLGTFGWYAVNYKNAVQHVVEAASGSQSVFYGSRSDLLTKLGYWISQLQKSYFALPVLGLLVLLTPIAIINRRRLGRLAFPDLLVAISAVWVGAILLTFSVNVNEDPRYLLAISPYIVIILSWVIAHVYSRLARCTVALAILLQFGVVTAQAFGIVTPLTQFSGWLRAYQPDDTALKDQMFCVSRTMDVSADRPALVGTEIEDFNAVGLSFYSVISGHNIESNNGWFYQGFDWSEADPKIAWNKSRQIDSKYYLYRKFGASEASVTNRHAAVEYARVLADPSFRFVPEKSNDRVKVYSRLPGLRSSSFFQSPIFTVFQGTNPHPSGLFGLLERPWAESVFQTDSLSLYGWAVSSPGFANIEIELDKKHVNDAKLVTRPDVQLAYPALRTTGFASEVDLRPIADGRHRLTLTLHAKDGSSRDIADVGVLVNRDAQGTNPQNTLPFGLLETPKSGFSFDGGTALQGWVVAPITLPEIEVLLDGNHLLNPDTQSRPDVVKAYKGEQATGFQAILPEKAISPGPHRITIVAHGPKDISRVIAQVSVTREEK